MHSVYIFIYLPNIYIAALQGIYSEALDSGHIMWHVIKNY